MMTDFPRELLLCQDFFPQIGGAHTWMYEVYKRWPRQVWVLANDYATDPDYEKKQTVFDTASHESLSIVRYPMSMEDISIFSTRCIERYWRIIQKIHRILNGQRGTLHCLRAFPEGIAAALYKKYVNRSCRIITYVHGEELNVAATSRQLSLFAGWVLGQSDLLICNSLATREKTLLFKPDISEPEVIHPGVEWGCYQVSKADIMQQRKKWGCRDGEIVLTTIARLEPRKNHRNVLDAMAFLRNTGIPIRYIIASDGEERLALEDQAKSLGMSDQVHFTGVISHTEKIRTFASADIHVMPSVEAGAMVEGFGIVFIEAAAAGTPSIAGNSGGQPEAVRHEKTGLIVDGTRNEAIADAILRLAADPRLREKMSSAGREWARSHDWDQVAKKTFHLISEKQDAIGTD